MAKGADVPRPAELHTHRLLVEVLDAVTDGLAVFDEDAVLVCCNEAFRALNPALADLAHPGVAWELLLREAVQRGAISPADADGLRRMEEELAKGRETVEPMELHLPTGGVPDVTMHPIAAGGFIVTQRDTTKSRLYEATDREADVLLRKVLEACPANVVMSRIGDGQILYRSPAATELFGNARRYYDHFASREERADLITALLPDGRVDNVQVSRIADAARVKLKPPSRCPLPSRRS
jgi:PAS domain-containing protein